MIIDWLLNWFSSLLTFQPITSVTLPELLSFYVQYLVLGILIFIPFVPFIRKRKRKREFQSIKSLFLLVPAEDFIFRAIPIWYIGSQAGAYFHILWALLHGIPQCVVVGVMGILDLRLWLGGLWIEAIFIHLFHDILCISIARQLSDYES